MKNRLAAASIAGIAIAGVASPAYAHGGEGALTPLSMGLGAAGLMAMILAALISSRGNRRTGVVVFVIGVVLITSAGADIASDIQKMNPPAVEVRLISPKDGAVVQSPVEFEVQVLGGTLLPLDQTQGSSTEGHLHVIIDGRTVDMPVTEKFTVQMPPGNHQVEVEFTGVDHQSYSPPILSRVRVRVAAPDEKLITDTAAK
ncbi:MAG: hypothetical protein DCC49_06035 [Acidobacteria bacterium]|nr:MAG: hypothetical protein DCC49_06035 [Acidobacteriota bacterium]